MSLERPPGEDGSEQADHPPRVHAHWYTVNGAAKLLGVSETVVRKRIQDRSLAAVKIGRGWRVLLPGEPPTRATEITHTRDLRKDTEQIGPTESLVVLVRDLQRQNLALAGHIGYLQSQLAQLKDESPVMEPDTATTTSDSTPPSMVSDADHQAALREIEDLRQRVQHYREELDGRLPRKKRWWRRS